MPIAILTYGKDVDIFTESTILAFHFGFSVSVPDLNGNVVEISFNKLSSDQKEFFEKAARAGIEVKMN